jgi:hypothetical protein
VARPGRSLLDPPPTVSTAEPGKPVLREVAALRVVGPAYRAGDDVYTMAFAGWPFAFRLAGPRRVSAATWAESTASGTYTLELVRFFPSVPGGPVDHQVAIAAKSPGGTRATVQLIANDVVSQTS